MVRFSHIRVKFYECLRKKDSLVINSIVLMVCLALAIPVAGAAELRPAATLERAETQLLAQRQDGVSWSMPG